MCLILLLLPYHLLLPSKRIQSIKAKMSKNVVSVSWNVWFQGCQNDSYLWFSLGLQIQTQYLGRNSSIYPSSHLSIHLIIYLSIDSFIPFDHPSIHPFIQWMTSSIHYTSCPIADSADTIVNNADVVFTGQHPNLAGNWSALNEGQSL